MQDNKKIALVKVSILILFIFSFFIPKLLKMTGMSKATETVGQ
jgi:hypothetical protein